MSSHVDPVLAEWLATQREVSLLMAHDLRNPLAAILANLNFLEIAVSPDDREVLDAVADIKLSADTLLRLIENAVTVARLEAAPTVEREETTVIDAGAAARVAFERSREAAQSAGVELELVLAPGPLLLRGEQGLFEQIVENLVTNVAQHVRRGQTARLALGTHEGGVQLVLADEGPAFGPVTRDFGREGQLELKKRSDSRYSRGLALYVVGLAARAMGGTVVVGPGASGHLTVTFPRADT